MSKDRDLVLDLSLNAPRHEVWRWWTEPELMKQWFAPAPWTTPHVDIDLRPGGSSLAVMRSPEGHEMPNPGVYLEVVPGERLVFTDAFTRAWEPSDKPFMTCVLDFADAGPGRTRYIATARHWSVADREAHEKMGFVQGWTTCAHQLEALAARL